MNAYAMARTAYGASTSVRTDRGNEYEALARITAALKNVAGMPKQHFPALAKALDDNRRLWTIIATDVADKGNGLPAQLKAQIFYLAEFTFEQTRRVLRGEASADILIEVNTMIMRGLRDQGASK